MKIINQSSDELTLQEGSTQGIVVGSVLLLAGILAAIFLRQSNPYVIWIALAAAVVGISVILFSSSITVTANKATGRLLYQKKRIVGGKDSTYAVADIFRIETRKQWQIQNTPPQPNQPMPQPQLVAQSVIVFKDGREVPLDHQKSSSTTTIGPAVLMGGQGAESAIAAQVAQFLNVPFQEIAPPPMAGAIQF